MELVHGQLLCAQDAQHVLQGARHEEILLFEPQFLAAQLVIVRIEHLAQVLGRHSLVDGAVVVAAVENRDIEGLGGFGAPQSQGVGGVGVVTQDGRVVRHADDGLARYPAHSRAVAFVHVLFGHAAELDFDGPLGPHQLPRIAEAQPFIGLLDLPAVDDLLMENTEFVTYAVADGRHFEGGQGIDEACRQASEAAVAESGFFFLLQQLVEIQSQFGDALLDPIEDSEIDQVVAQVRAHQKFGRQVRHGPRGLLGVGRRRADPALQHAVAHREGERHVVVVLGRQRREFTLHIE